MQEEFNRILALVDFSNVPLRVAEEAAMIASKFKSELHLLHVTSISNAPYLLAPEAFFFKVAADDIEVKHADIDKIKTHLNERFGVSIEWHEAKGKLCDEINKYADNLQVDLIVLGAKKENWLKELLFESTAKSIIKKVNKEVLCVYPDSGSQKLKKIVLPIGNFIPKRKIRLAYELARKFAANIHLITLNKNRTSLSSEDTKILMASYQYLKDITNIPIECRTVQGDSLASATIHYAENIGADLILVNAGPESDLKGAVLHRWGGNIVNHSTIPVLSVHAINDKIKNNQYRA